MKTKIDINSASARQLTQLPGIAKNTANRIVNQRARHGYFAFWEELTEVKDFPMHVLEQIKQHATLALPGNIGGNATRRRLKPDHVNRQTKKSKGYTKKLRPTSIIRSGVKRPARRRVQVD